jgi:hypothetical protein
MKREGAKTRREREDDEGEDGNAKARRCDGNARLLLERVETQRREQRQRNVKIFVRAFAFRFLALIKSPNRLNAHAEKRGVF